MNGLYQVSNLGRIKSLGRKVALNDKTYRITHDKILTPKNINSYCHIILYNKKYKNFRIHRLVAEAFIPNPHNYTIVNHIDGNKQNNKVKNLQWCSQRHNILEAYRLKLMKPRKLKINQYDLQGNFIKQWNSIKEIEIFYNCRHISACCKGKRKTAKGFIWRYADK